MIYVCVPVHNEARTAGLVLWKVRQVFTAFPREYELRAQGLARRWTPRLLRVAGLRDTVSGFLALRLIVLRQALRRDTSQFLQTEGWCASAELVARLAPHARRLDTVPAAARYDLVQRP